MISSDVLEQQFGATDIEVWHQDTKVRIICTKVVATGQILEVSRVSFVPDGVLAFAKVHNDIVAGQSMGKAFRAHNISFVRRTISAYKRVLPAGFGKVFDGNRPANVVLVSIFAGNNIHYADILETYSPAVVWPQKMPQPVRQPVQDIAALDAFVRQKFSQ